jgi:hypothetical protein
VLVTGLVDPDASRLVEHDPDAVGGHPLRVDTREPVEARGLVSSQEQEAVHVRRGERADPSHGCVLVDVAQQLGTRGHTLTKRVGEQRQLCVADAKGGKAGVRQRDVQPGCLRGGSFATPSRSGPTEQLVECEDLLTRGGLIDDRRQPGPGAASLADPEEQQALVILVEPRQHVALDVGQIDLGIVGRRRVTVGAGSPLALVGRVLSETAPGCSERSKGRARAPGLE